MVRFAIGVASWVLLMAAGAIALFLSACLRLADFALDMLRPKGK